MEKISVEATVDNTYKVMSFVDEQLEKSGCSLEAQTQIDLALEELYVNIAQYAYAPGTGTVEIEFEVRGDPRTACITLTDRGRKYNPLEKEDPDINLPLKERSIGGLGIFLVKQDMDDIRYEYRDGKNILTIGKKI